MSSKQIIYISMFVGSLIGGWIPSALWDAGMFDLSSVFFTALGGALGIYIGYKFTQD